MEEADCAGLRAGRTCWSGCCSRLTARRGQFPFLEDLGSSLWRLGRVGTAGRQARREAVCGGSLADEEGLTVETVTLTQEADAAHVTAELTYQGETLSVTLEVQ